MTPMTSFQYMTPPLRLFYGPESLQSLGKELARLGSQRAVVFCGRWAAGPMLDAVRASMGERCAAVFDGVVTHSPVNSVVAAAQLLTQVQADAVIALGGGSAIVTARAASILAAEGKDVRALCTAMQADGSLKSPKLLAPKLPQIIVPTTPTTAMVKAGSAVFDPEAGERLAMFDPKTRAQSIFIEPALLLSAPRALVVSASLNAYATVFEGLMSRTGNPLADGLLMHSARLLARHLPAPLTHDDPAVRGELVLSAMLCGQGSDHTGAGVTTAIGHAIGAQHGVENGLVNAVMLPHVLRFNAAHAQPGFAKVGAALGLHQTDDGAMLEALVESVRATFDALGLPKRLRDLGVTREALPAIARHAMGDWFLRGNPRQVENAAEIEQLLELAW